MLQLRLQGHENFFVGEIVKAAAQKWAQVRASDRREGVVKALSKVLFSGSLLLSLGLGVFGASGEGEGELRWLSYETARQQAASEGKILCVLATRQGCPYTPGARAAFEHPRVRARVRRQFVLALLDLSSPEAREIGEQLRISAVPLLLFSASNGNELWRATAPDDPETLAVLLEDVLSGELDYGSQQARLERGELEPDKVLKLARAYRDAGERSKAASVYRMILEMPRRFSRADRQRASRELAYLFEDPSEQTKALRRHLRRFRKDVEAGVNLALLLLREEGKPEEVQRIVKRALGYLRTHESEYPSHFVTSAYRVAHDIVFWHGPRSCSWVIPYAERALELEPKEGWFLQNVLTLADLCGREETATRAIDRFRQAYGEDSMPEETKARFERFLTGIVEDAEKAASESRQKRAGLARAVERP